MQAIETVSATFEDDAQVLDAVVSLVDKNLLQQSAQEAVQGLKGYLVRANPAWLERLEREQNNLRAAIEWSLEPAQAGSREDSAFSVGWALVKFCMVRGFYSEGQAVLEQLLAQGAAPAVRVKTLIDAADFAEAQGEVDQAKALDQESLVLCRELGDKRGIAYCLRELRWVAQTKGHNSTAARSLMEECLAIFREVGDRGDIAWSLSNVADLVCLQWAYSRGLALFEESLALYRELGHKRGIALCLRQSAVWLFLGASGDRAAIRAGLDESLVIYREVGDKLGAAIYGWIAGWVVLGEGDANTAHAPGRSGLCRRLERGTYQGNRASPCHDTAY